MVFILTSRWPSGFFYHHQNFASAFRLVLLLPTISPFLMMIKTIIEAIKTISPFLTCICNQNTLQVDLLVALFSLKFFSPCFDHMKKVLIKKLPLN